MSAEDFYQQRKSIISQYSSDLLQQSTNYQKQIEQDNENAIDLKNNVDIANAEISSEKKTAGSELIAGSAFEIPSAVGHAKTLVESAKNAYGNIVSAGEDIKTATQSVKSTLETASDAVGDFASNIKNNFSSPPGVESGVDLDVKPFQPRTVEFSNPLFEGQTPKPQFGDPINFTGAQLGSEQVPVLPTTSSIPSDVIGSSKSAIGQTGDSLAETAETATSAVGDVTKGLAETAADLDPVTAVAGLGLGLFGLVKGIFDEASASAKPIQTTTAAEVAPSDLSNVSAVAQEGI